MIKLFKVFMAKNTSHKVQKVLNSGYITQGTQVDIFETKLKEWFNYPYILTLNSATSGLILALRLLNLNYKDEVLCCPLTCFATTSAILENRLNIKWVDVDPDTCNICLEDLKNKLTNNTKAILIVHWGGSPVDLTKLKSIRDRINPSIPIIEDCAHSFGAMYDGDYLGKHGNICVYSTQAIKHLTTGDGGFIFLPNEELYKRAKLLRWYGINRENKNESDFRLENNIEEWGYKFHMNDINATIGIENLKYMKDNLKKIRNIANYYDNELKNLSMVEIIKPINNSISSYWLYTLKVWTKSNFIDWMTKKGIMVSQVHKRNDLHSCVEEFNQNNLLKLNELENFLICIPIGWWIDEDIAKYIVNSIKTWNVHYINQELMVKYNLRCIREDDYDDYINLMRMFNLDNIHIDKSTFIDKLKKIKNQNSTLYVLEYYGKIVATVKILIEIKIAHSVAHVEDIVVDKDYRNKGFGSFLLKKIKHIASTFDVYKIILNCKDKQDLICFYEKNNFVKEGLLYTYRLSD